MIEKSFESNNITYNMYSERLISKIIDIVIKDRIMIDFYCGDIKYKDLFQYQINKHYRGNRDRLYYREHNVKHFIYGANLILPVDSEEQFITVQEYLMYEKAYDLYMEIKKYCKENNRKLQEAINRGDKDREYIYSKRMDSPLLKEVLNHTSKRVSGGFTRLANSFEHNYPTFRGVFNRKDFENFLGETRYSDDIVLLFDLRRSLCFKGVCIKAPVIEVLGLQELEEMGMDNLFNDYQNKYISKARVAMLMDMGADECLKEIRLESGVIYEEIKSDKASELIREYLNNKREDYETLAEFGEIELDRREYDNRGIVKRNNKVDIEPYWLSI